jgi:hypothetical protein
MCNIKHLICGEARRAMTAWPQMRFPVQWRTFDEENGLVVFAVGNDMPDVDVNGPYIVQSWTLLEYAGDNQWSREEDIYNPDAMLRMLGRWCEAAGVSFPSLKGRPDRGSLAA